MARHAIPKHMQRDATVAPDDARPAPLSRSNLIKGAFAAVASAVAGPSPSAQAEIIGEVQASGLVFKDTINVQRITDPKVSGITIYQTDFSKSSFDKIKSGNLLQAD